MILTEPTCRKEMYCNFSFQCPRWLETSLCLLTHKFINIVHSCLSLEFVRKCSFSRLLLSFLSTFHGNVLMQNAKKNCIVCLWQRSGDCDVRKPSGERRTYEDVLKNSLSITKGNKS